MLGDHAHSRKVSHRKFEEPSFFMLHSMVFMLNDLRFVQLVMKTTIENRNTIS